jgi:PBP1b-binding outer membrane lipoprotein LpoB
MKRITALASLALVALILTGCPNTSQRVQAAQAAENASIIVNGFEQGEIAAHDQGLIPDPDHLFIQKSMRTVAAMGKTTDGCIGTTTSNAGIVSCINTAIGTVDQLNKDGALYLKSDKAKTDFALAMLGTRTSLAVITVLLGGK